MVNTRRSQNLRQRNDIREEEARHSREERIEASRGNPSQGGGQEGETRIDRVE